MDRYPDRREAAQLFNEALECVRDLLDAEIEPSAGRRPRKRAPLQPPEAIYVPNAITDSREFAKILVVDDDAFSATMIDNCLRAAGFLCSYACQAEEALSAIENELPDLIIMDVVMPGVDGFELCRRVRNHPAMHFTPIIFVTRKGDVVERVKGLEAGGNDYLSKPFEPEELIARVRSHLTRLAALREMAIRDSLTRCFNHKYLRMRLEQEVARCQRYDQELTLAMIDVDHFKQVNDTYGHPAGDVVLAHLANIIVASVRSTDVVARYGGEEFAVLMVEASAEEGSVVCNRLRERVQAYAFRTHPEALDDQGRHIPITVSIGVAELGSKKDTAAALLERADEALYRAKNEGRNRVITHVDRRTPVPHPRIA
jgi:diguanylate cyclase (GGDEF)-like protein